jgi:hypothetical protein
MITSTGAAGEPGRPVIEELPGRPAAEPISANALIDRPRPKVWYVVRAS